MMSNEVSRKNVTQSWPWEQTDDGSYIPGRLSVCPWALTGSHNKHDFDWNSSLV